MAPQSSTTTYNFRVPGNEIPNWFDHQSVGSSISFWVGPRFPNFALCLVFGSEDERFVCFVDISINGRKRNFTCKHFSKLRYDHLWFYWSQNSFQWLFKDLNLGDRNHVELFCKIASPSKPTTILPNIIKRIGVHTECICPQPKPSLLIKVGVIRSDAALIEAQALSVLLSESSSLFCCCYCIIDEQDKRHVV